MKTNTASSILSLIKKEGKIRPYDLMGKLSLSTVAIHKQLKKLVLEGKLVKIGSSPKVYYILSTTSSSGDVVYPEQAKEMIDARYLYIRPNGVLLYGHVGFTYWAKEINKTKDILSLANNYVNVCQQIDRLKGKFGWIDVTEKVRSTFPQLFLDRLLYADFYSLPVFGKTLLGQLVLHAKLSQDRKLIHDITTRTKPIVEAILHEFHLDGVSFIPATIHRQIQFMKEFRESLEISLPSMYLTKIKVGDVTVAQKTLSNLRERVDNARDTILVDSIVRVKGKKILLIDDAVGSGASMNETAKKFKSMGAASVIGFAPVGSMKGFDIIREV